MKMKFVALLFNLVTLHCAYAQPSNQANEIDATTVLASSAKVTVTRGDLEAELVRIPEKDRHEFLLSRSRVATFVESILINKTLALEAREAGMDRDPKVVAEIANQTEKVLSRYRGAQIRRTAKEIDLTSRARENYILNRDKYKRQAIYGTWTVNIARGRSLNDAELRRKAEDILKRAKAGESLEDLARAHSDHFKAKENGGMNVPVTMEKLNPLLAATIVALKPGEFTDVIETPSDYYVVKLTAHYPEVIYTFDELKRELLIDERNTYEMEIQNGYLQKIRTDPSVKINIDALEAVRPQTAAPTVPGFNAPVNK